MKRYMEKLDTLKEMVQVEENFGKIFEYFFAHVAGDPDFEAAGKKGKHAILKKLLNGLCRQMFGEESSVSGTFIIQLRLSRFFHGSCFLDGRPTAFFFFEEIDKGMIAITMSMAGKMHYVRFSSTFIGADKAIILPDPNRKPTIH